MDSAVAFTDLFINVAMIVKEEGATKEKRRGHGRGWREAGEGVDNENRAYRYKKVLRS